MEFVPEGFEPPRRLETPAFVLEPLGPEHNEDDYAAWTSSVEHIRSTPGFEGRQWPRELTLEENRADLERHAEDFALRRGFTYTVREPGGGAIVGCVYIYPAEQPAAAEVRSWVRADRAALDRAVRAAVREWLATGWPFCTVEYEAG
jgi:hypothetical protein